MSHLSHYEKLADLPYEIPANWAWCIYKYVGICTSGKTPKSEELCANGTLPYFKVAEMNLVGNEKYLKFTQNYLCDTYAGVTFPANSIVFPKNGGAVLTNKKRILAQKSVVDLNTGVYLPHIGLNHDYIFMCFSTIDFRKLFKGGVLPTLDRSIVEKRIIPIPPLNEQKRIAEQVKFLLEQVELIQK